MRVAKLGLAAVWLFVGCSTSDPVSSPLREQSATSSPSDTTGRAFTDEQLRAVVHLAISAGSEGSPLTQLDATGRGIKSLDGIQQLTSLRVLMLGQNQLTDITPLAALAALTRLDLSENQIANLEALSCLTQIQDLQLTANHVHDLQPLSSLTNLRSLLVAGNPVRDLSPLLPLAELRNLEVSDSSVADTTAATQVVALRERGVEVLVKTSPTAVDTGASDTSHQARIGALIGTRIAFLADLEDRQFDLYMVDNYGHRIRLTHDGRERSDLSWAPGGRHLAYAAKCRTRTGGWTWQVYVLDVQTGVETLLTDPDALCLGPAWSPDGRQIAVTIWSGYLGELYLLDADGSYLQQLTHLNLAIEKPGWSSQGRSLLFEVPPNFPGLYGRTSVGIYEVATSGGAIHRFTALELGGGSSDPPDSAGYRELAVSPVDRRVAYACSAGLVVLDLATGESTALTPRLIPDPIKDRKIRQPAWAPDGKRLLVVGDSDLWDSLWIIDADGGDPVQINEDSQAWPPASFWYPAWAPQ